MHAEGFCRPRRGGAQRSGRFSREAGASDSAFDINLQFSGETPAEGGSGFDDDNSYYDDVLTLLNNHGK